MIEEPKEIIFQVGHSSISIKDSELILRCADSSLTVRKIIEAINDFDKRLSKLEAIQSTIFDEVFSDDQSNS